MANVSHTHPHTDQGAMNRVFDRGPVATDGSGSAETSEDESRTMAEVSHTPPKGAGDSSEVFERGYERQVRQK